MQLIEDSLSKYAQFKHLTLIPILAEENHRQHVIVKILQSGAQFKIIFSMREAKASWRMRKRNRIC